jgi:hypothetical protein
MRGFAVISRAQKDEVQDKTSVLNKILGIKEIILPYKEKEIFFDELVACKISVTEGLEKAKIRRAYKTGLNKYGLVLSKDFEINNDSLFHHSCLVRALDFFTISLGCDLRFNEVVIADASTPEGRNFFKLLLPISRRILLVTNNKGTLAREVDYAISKYGTSVAVVEDPIKASESADVIVMASSNPDHKYLAELNRPMLFYSFLKAPTSKLWFNDISIAYKNGEEIESIYGQGYLRAIKKDPIWYHAENNGFIIKTIKKDNISLIER